jgi:hypothetical protein
MEKLHLKGLKILPLKTTVSEETLKWAIEGMQLIHKVATARSRHSSFPEGQLSSSNAQNYYWLEVLLVDPRFYFMKTLQTTWMTKLPMK